MEKTIALCFILISVSLYAETDAEKIAKLEARITKLEKQVQPLLAEQEAKENRMKLVQQAQVRMRKDSAIYNQDTLRDIEKLYQVANRKWRSTEGKSSLEELIEKYPDANRTGCALLYLGQMSNGDQQIEYLQRAIKDFSDCYYGDGVQVGAYARFMLAQVYLKQGKKDAANKLFAEIKTDYPNAISHRGQSLIKFIDAEMAKQK